ncbi:type VI secretion system-associated protein VasI [Pelagibaculum spongiae]|uniref:Type VI secretion system-associated protein TagO n=1 Tax=Pelagibaculum spongiae TaxID=2080658 RepID=A0A2V1GZI2_9GAMM|nr:type VI secretion system-associated protein VasI [Pelagibaculum spongiae]PVZ68782.1 type VI secretion system-associated protein TagO [Pelagibaculum spongiae]
MGTHCLAVVMMTWLFIVSALTNTVHAEQQNSVIDSAIDWEWNKSIVNAQKCAEMTSKLPRLTCFDQLFPANQPTLNLALEVAKQLTKRQLAWAVDYPKRWLQLMAWQKKQTNPHLSEFTLTSAGFSEPLITSENNNYWLFATALGQVSRLKDTGRPMLLLSCIDNISRVELLLPEAVDQPRFSVNLTNEKGHFPQQWMSDETGYVVRSGRGLPAVSAMKFMLKSDRFSLRSDNQLIDGLLFETQQLTKAIKPLRDTCSW